MPVNLNTQQTVPASQGGAAAHVGAIGEHTVTLSGQPPLRLDKIKGNPLPFQGFRVATRIQSAEKGMQTNVTAALGALTRPGGRLNPKALMGGLKAFHTSLDNFIRLENTPASRVDQVVVEQLSKSVESLSSRDLAATYQTFQSREMTLLKDALQAEARRNPGNTDVKAALAALFDLEAVVLKEVSERMISVMDLVAAKPQTPEQETAQDAALRAGRRERAVEGADAYANDLSPRNVAILVERSAEAHTRAENTLNARTGAMLADRNVGIDARQIGDTLRGSELTMNVDVSFLFGEGGAIKTGVWENIHHISERALAAGEKAPKGPEYIPFRNAVEEHVFPELAGRPARANERPSYAALNVSGDKRGAVPNYGQTAFVLRPEAAQRATYTAIDTFKKIPLQFNAERRDELTRSLNELASLPGMDENTWTQLRDSDSELRRALDEALTHVPDGPLTLTDMEALIVQETGGTENAPAKAIVNMWVRPLLINAFGDADANRSSTATYDTLENLLPQMEDGVDGEGLIHAAASGESRFTLPGRYIEAQLQGTFVPSRDVAEIRIDSGELIDYKNRCINGERLAALRDFTQANGIKLTIQDFYANLAELASGSWERQAWDELRSIPGINVITQSEVLEDTGPKAGEYTLSLAAQEFSNTHQSIGQTKEAARGLIADAQKLDEQLRGLAAELGISTEDGVPLAGEAMNRVKARFVENVERAIAEASAQGKGINSDAVLSEALRSAAERPLRAKAALLAEMELLEFDNPEQKAAFRGWVVSARALSDPREMRLIHANAMAQVARMERLGPHPALADLSREFANGLRNLYQGVDAFKLEANPDDFGPDDLFTEINRVAFMSATLLKAVNPGLAEQMLETLEAPAARELRGVCAALHGSRTEDLVADDKPFAATLGDMMSFTADAFARQLGKPLSAPPSLSGDIDLASGGTRAALAAAAPNIAAELN
ncbi:MAG: DUF3626 domain-containing protein, partial [Zoogloeaceae bacterium]|nr:DUF3626 domain-containing protein [Zoogloeaceae bacterium]